jgi:hypothetical protein
LPAIEDAAGGRIEATGDSVPAVAVIVKPKEVLLPIGRRLSCVP